MNSVDPERPVTTRAIQALLVRLSGPDKEHMMTIRMPAAERIGHISGTTTTCIHGIAGTNKDCAKYPPGRPGSGGPAILPEVFSTVLERRPEFQGPLLPLRLVGRRGRFGDDGVADSSSSPWRCPSLPVQHHPPVPSVAEALDRWRVGDGEQALRSEFLDVLAMVPDPRDPRGRYRAGRAAGDSWSWLPRQEARLCRVRHLGANCAGGCVGAARDPHSPPE